MKAKATDILTAGMAKAGSFAAATQAQLEADPAYIAQQAIAAPYKRQEQATNENAQAYRNYMEWRKQRGNQLPARTPALDKQVDQSIQTMPLQGKPAVTPAKPLKMRLPKVDPNKDLVLPPSMETTVRPTDIL